MSMVQYQQFYEFQKIARLMKGKKTPKSSSILDARVVMLKVKTEISNNESLFAGEKPKANKKISSP